MKLPDYNATMEELIDHVAKLQKHVQFLMEGNLGSKNIREVGDFLVGQKSFASRDGMVGISSLVAGQENVRFWAGASVPEHAPYRVYDSGRLVAQNADIEGSIKMGAGSSISWNDVNSDPLATNAYNTANSAYGQATAAQSIAHSIALGTYVGSPTTFINERSIYSPNLVGGTIQIGNFNPVTGKFPFDVTSTGAVTASNITVTGGNIEGASNIDVYTNLRVGNHIFIGQMTDMSDKTINMKSLVSIEAVADALELHALAGVHMYSIGEVTHNGQQLATRNWVEGSALITARFG